MKTTTKSSELILALIFAVLSSATIANTLKTHWGVGVVIGIVIFFVFKWAYRSVLEEYKYAYFKELEESGHLIVSLRDSADRRRAISLLQHLEYREKPKK